MSLRKEELYKYSKLIRKANELIIDAFRKLVVIDETCKSFPVPIVWMSKKLLADWKERPSNLLALMNKNFRSYSDECWLIDYELIVEATKHEDMKQLIEQVMSKFNPILSLPSEDVPWLSIEKQTKQGNAWEFSLVAELRLKKDTG
jgi:hypothetical protein